MNKDLKKLKLPEYIMNILNGSKGVIIPKKREDLIQLAMGNSINTAFDVAYQIQGRGRVLEATVTKCKNGVVINYLDDYMRRRDPECLYVADDKETDKPRYQDNYNQNFDIIRREEFEWLKNQELIFFPF